MKLTRDSNNFSKAGINSLFLIEWNIADNQFGGKQLNLIFSPTEKPNEEGKQLKYYYSHNFKGAFKQSFQFTSNLEAYREIAKSLLENGNAIFEQELDNLFGMDIPNDDKDKMFKIEENFVVAVFSHLPKELGKVNVVLHYSVSKKDGKWYLSIPNSKTNFTGKKWNLPFGTNPVIGESLVMEKPEEMTIEQEVSNESNDSNEESNDSVDSGSDFPTGSLDNNLGGDLPF